jgi:hypothetical protein
MSTTTNYENYLADTKELINMAEKLILEHKEGFFEDLNWLRNFILYKAVKGNFEAVNIDATCKIIYIFYRVLPYACLSANSAVKEILLSKQVKIKTTNRPLLSSFFTPLDDLVNEVTKLCRMGFEFDNTLLLIKSIETLTGNFIKQFQWNYDITTTKGDKEVTFLCYLGSTPISMPTVNIKEINASNSITSFNSFVNFAKTTTNFKRRKNLREVIVEWHNNNTNISERLNKLYFTFIFSDKLGFVNYGKIICKHSGNVVIWDFLHNHRNLINMIYPNYYNDEILHFVKANNNLGARKKIIRKFNYEFKEI